MISSSEMPWDKNLQLLLALIVAFNVLPHIPNIPYWITLLALICFVWKYLHLTKATPLPNRWTLRITTILASAGCVVHYGTALGHAPASALLVCLASLKIVETNRYRDAMLVIFTSFFLLMAHLLESQSLVSTIFMSLDVLLITTLMFHVHKRDRRQSARSFRPAMRMLALTLPLWVILFVAFPRFSSALWNSNRTQATTGFGEDLNPGAVGKLAESDEPAFRVSFKGGARPSPENLYWRGAILSISDGLQWTRQPGNVPAESVIDIEDSEQNQPNSNTGAKTSYEVWLEPGFQKWLFVLEYARALTAGDWSKTHQIRKRIGFVYETGREVRTRLPYQAVASLRAPRQSLSDREKTAYLQVSRNLPERVKSLIAEIQNTDSSPSSTATLKSARAEALSRTLTKWMSDNYFTYTLSPGEMSSSRGVDQLEEFLFETRRGFCEHFAGTYATLMRAMGIPARVVVGFQGGRYNEVGEYLLVRHLDAHAWAEIWIADDTRGDNSGRWMRVDPTETVAPLRLQLGGDYHNIDPRTLASGMSGSEIRRSLERGIKHFVDQLLLMWDALQMRWNAFLLRYDLEYQLELLALLGLGSGTVLALITVLLTLTILFALAYVIVLKKRAHRFDPVRREWERFSQGLSKIGLDRSPSEGPLSYQERLTQARPQDAKVIDAVVSTYIDLRYAESSQTPNSAQIHQLKRAVTQSLRRLSRRSSSPDA